MKSYKKMLAGLTGAILLTLPLMAGTCTPAPSNDCDSEADCSTDQHCHPTLKTCVDNCKKVDGACDVEPGTACSEVDIIEPVGGLAFNGVCVCDPDNDTCETDTKCNPYDRTCDVPCTADTDCSGYPIDQNRTCQDGFCLLPADDCRSSSETNNGCDSAQVCDNRSGSTTAGQCIDKCTDTSCGSQVCDSASGLCIDACTAGSCGAGKYCDDSRFAGSNTCIDNPGTCDNDSCLSGGSNLCDPVATNETHNLCVDADSVTNTCGASGSRSGGPVIYVDDPSVDIAVTALPSSTAGQATAGDPGHCTDPTTGQGAGTVMEVTFIVDGGMSSNPYQDTYFWNGSSWVAPYQAIGASSGGVDILTVYLCYQSSGPQTPAFYHDGTSGESNRACVDLTVP